MNNQIHKEPIGDPEVSVALCFIAFGALVIHQAHHVAWLPYIF